VVDWHTFKYNILRYMNNQEAANEDALARFITDEYDKAMSGAEIILTKNKITSSNKWMFWKHMHDGFISAKEIPEGEGAADSIFRKAISDAAIAYWTGAIMSSKYYGRLPGHIGFIPPCVVTNPGMCSYIAPRPANNMDSSLPFVDALVDCFKRHLLTITGIHTMIRPPTPSGPYPLVWTGIK